METRGIPAKIRIQDGINRGEHCATEKRNGSSKIRVRQVDCLSDVGVGGGDVGVVGDRGVDYGESGVGDGESWG